MKLFRLIGGLFFVLITLILAKTSLVLLISVKSSWNGWLPLHAISFSTGFLVWLLAFVLLPRPATAYILGHELTHAFWGFLFGKSIRKISVSDHEGSVSLSGVNFLIVLSPYFFPFYSVLVILIYFIVWLFVNPVPVVWLWMGLLGVSWGFHVTFTFKALGERQPDFEVYGRFFSYTFILLINLFIVCVTLFIVTDVSLEMFVSSLKTDTLRVIDGIRFVFLKASEAIKHVQVNLQ
ncbi:MAG: hypothetical protein GX811_05160 [Lentisphaerae bacterium]|nr:hypothetical protein [Lentisphaerota bacterium]